MLQQDEPEDFILATGKTRSVKDVVEMCFEMAGLNWKDYVDHDAEMDRSDNRETLEVDVSKAKEKLGWTNETPFKKTLYDCLVKDCGELGAPLDWVNHVSF
jgi:GDPmannose 4,6-dehydratase